MKKFISGAAAAALVALGIVAGAAAPASAHTPAASATCEALTVDATYYDGVKPGSPGSTKEVLIKEAWTETVVDVPAQDAVAPTLWEFKHHKKGKVRWEAYDWNAAEHEDGNDEGGGNGKGWYRTGINNGKDAVPAVTHEVNHPAEYETQSIPGTPEDTTPNSVVVTIDGQQVAAEEFGSSFHAVYPFADKYTAHQWSVAITAWNDANGSKGWTKTITGTSTPCEQPVVSIPCTTLGEWFTEGDDVAPSLSPEGYVFQSTDSKVAGLRAAAGGNLQGWSPVSYAASGDTESFWYRIVLDTSADGGWGYMSATVTSGQPVTSSSTAYVSKLGQSFTLTELAELYPHNVITSVGFHLDRGHGPVTLSSVGGACGTADFTTEKPDDVVFVEDGTPIITCDNKVGDVIEVTNAVRTTPFVWDGSKFVAGETVVTHVGGTYTVTQEDVNALDCAVVVIPPTETPKPATPAPVTAPVTTANTLATTGDATSGIYTVLAGVLLAAGGIIMVSRRIARKN